MRACDPPEPAAKKWWYHPLSGCGCSGSVVCSYILSRLKQGELKRVLFVGTGALMSAVSAKQGETIPGIAHGVLLTNG